MKYALRLSLLLALAAIPGLAQRGMVARPMGTVARPGDGPGGSAGPFQLGPGTAFRRPMSGSPGRGFHHDPCRLGQICRTDFGRRRGSLNYGFAYTPYWPLYGFDDGYSSSSGVSQMESALTEQQRQNAELEVQLRVERLRRADEEARALAPAPAAAAAPATAAKEPDGPSTMLVFKDGSRREVQNYAISGNTLYEIGGYWTRKVPLVNLDVPATVKANDDRGIQFSLPAGMAKDQ